MTTPSLLRPRLQHFRALLVGLAIATAAPAFADNIPEVQKLIKQGQFPQALEKIDAYLATRPKDAQGRFFKGLILTELGRSGDAIAVFTKLSEEYPELPEPYNNLAVLYAQQKQYDKARAALEMAIRTHPSYAIAYENLGDIYAKLASQAYDKALQLDNANANTQNKLSMIRDLISAGGRGNVKAAVPQSPVTPTATTPTANPAPPATNSTTAASKPAQPSATVLTAAPGAAANTPASKPVPASESKPEVRNEPAAKPDPKPEPPKADLSRQDVIKALSNWASAWSRKDMKAYFASYANGFRPPNGLTRKAWEQEREARINGKSDKISVAYANPQVAINGDRATVRFQQDYSAGSLKSSTMKTLVFTRNGSKWLIVEENAR